MGGVGELTPGKHFVGMGLTANKETEVRDFLASRERVRTARAERAAALASEGVRTAARASGDALEDGGRHFPGPAHDAHYGGTACGIGCAGPVPTGGVVGVTGGLTGGHVEPVKREFTGEPQGEGRLTVEDVLKRKLTVEEMLIRVGNANTEMYEVIRELETKIGTVLESPDPERKGPVYPEPNSGVSILDVFLNIERDLIESTRRIREISDRVRL